MLKFYFRAVISADVVYWCTFIHKIFTLGLCLPELHISCNAMNDFVNIAYDVTIEQFVEHVCLIEMLGCPLS